MKTANIEDGEPSASALADQWWSESAEWQGELYWKAALAKLGPDDRRVLVAGPGNRDGRHRYTLGVLAFLQKAGFAPEILEGQADPDEHRAQADAYPRIVALPVSVGSCTEVLHFASIRELRRRLLVVLPEEHRSGYFAKVLSLVHEVPVRTCRTMVASDRDEAHKGVGASILYELARHIHSQGAQEMARKHADAAPPENSVQGRASRISLLQWLSNTQGVRLDNFRVVGKFLCGDLDKRARLLQAVDRLRQKVTRRLEKPYAVLVCGKPGSGKSLFVREVAKELSTRDSLIEANLSDAEEIPGLLRKHYQQIILQRSDVPIAFLDEVDTKIRDDHAYRHLLRALVGDLVDLGNGTQGKLPGVLWFFAASSGSDLKSFKQHLATVQKGPDFVRRFSQEGEIIELTGPNSPIEVVIQVIALLKGENPLLRVVDKGLLFLFGTESWADGGELAREVREVSASADGSRFIDFKHHAASERLRVAYDRERESLFQATGTLDIE